MKFNLFLTRFALISMPFLAACSSSSSSGGPAAPVAPLSKAQKTSFLTYLKASNKTMEVMSIFSKPAAGGRPPTALTIALSIAAQNGRPDGGNNPNSTGEYSRILNQELSEGKCAVRQGAPSQTGKSEFTSKSSISGANCSFEASFLMTTSLISESHNEVNIQMDLKLKNQSLIKRSEVHAGKLETRLGVRSASDKSVQMTIAMNGSSETKSFGTVTNVVNMSMGLRNDGTAPTLAMTGQYSSKSWNAVFNVSSRPGEPATATLNGENIDEATMKEISAGFGAATGGTSPVVGDPTY